MYEEFFGMKQTPFMSSIPTDCLYLSSMLDETLGRLEFAAEKQLFAIVTADVGCGKTTALRRFVSELDTDRYVVLYLADSKLTPRWFYKGLLDQLGIESRFYRGDAKRQLHQQLEIIRKVQDRKVITIVDEAHLLAKETLEEIRFLLNYRMDSMNPMGLILSGQNELWDKLKLQRYAAIRQRIDVQSVLNHYDRSQTGAYIRSHLAYAGVTNEIFTEAAMDEIHQYTAGTARMIDKVCTSVLLYGSQSHLRLIDDRTVKLVLECEFS